jgi:hypothetical protein
VFLMEEISRVASSSTSVAFKRKLILGFLK